MNTENRTHSLHAKFFVMHSILLYSSLKLSLKNHPFTGLDLCAPGKPSEDLVKPGAVTSCLSAVMCSSYHIPMLPPWKNLAAGLSVTTQKQGISYPFLLLFSSQLVPGISKSLQELFPSPSTHPPPSVKANRLPRFESPIEM